MASLTPTHDLPTITEGDDVTIPVTFVKQNGSPVDISGWTTSLTIAEQTRGQQGGGTAIIQKDVAPADATGGKTNFHLDPADTAGLSGPKRYDIQVTQDNSVVKTVVLGTVAFVDGVTDRDITSSGPPGTTGSLTADGIEVTMGDGNISVAVSVAGAFSAADAVAAMDGATITPAQLGTQADAVNQTYTDELSVGNSQPVTGGPVGDDGDWIPLSTFRTTNGFSTTSSTYEPIWANSKGETTVLPFNKYNSVTNIGKVGLNISAELYKGGSGAERYATVGGYQTPIPEAEITGGGITVGPIAEYTPSSNRIAVFIKSDGKNTIQVRNISIGIWGKVQ